MTASDKPRQLLERFYYDGWNKNNENVVMECLHERVRFRSAMGKKKNGSSAVVEHMKKMHKALGNHTKKIDDVVITENKCAARIKCYGVHRSEFFGQPGTGHELQWCNAAFFTIRDDKITELWVLGDIDGLKNQLGAEQNATPF